MGGQTYFALGMYLLQVEDLDIRHPDLLHQRHIHWDQGIFLVSELKRDGKCNNNNVNNIVCWLFEALNKVPNSVLYNLHIKRIKTLINPFCAWSLTNVYCY